MSKRRTRRLITTRKLSDTDRVELIRFREGKHVYWEGHITRPSSLFGFTVIVESVTFTTRKAGKAWVNEVYTAA